ncbi:putative pentatricopeptide repeat-containing protein [Heracleum sosnowskyi]|uniref:Pentatricopeptide repeat-containing protein n=1 Tax=Heracleum sosnowskyi TaxID=360622 RepID=A0AAD8J209_9APIA|nr:putative pentatricopeptide repeat-containing protein [Heracleum sosnowskyi]
MSSYSSNYLRLLSLTKLLTSHVNNARHEEALSLFHHIHSTLSLDPFVFPLALKSCAAIRRPHLGTSIHSHLIKTSHSTNNPFIACALIDMYGKCVSISSARKVFDEMPDRNVVMWNAMISLYAHCRDYLSKGLELFEVMDVLPNHSTFNSIIAGLSEVEDGSYKAIEFYRRMRRLGLKPNLITVLALMNACVGMGVLNMVKEVHGFSIRNDIDWHPHFRSGLVEAYGRCGCLENACVVFRSLQERDVVAWSSLISAYAFHGEARIALKIFEEMEMAKVKPDEIAFLGVLKACSHAGLPDEARMYFARMHDEYGVEPRSDHYSCLVDVLGRSGRLHEAYEVIRGMPVKVTAKAWGALLAGCRTYGEVELAEIAGRALFELEPDNAANYVILSRIYGNVGRHDEAQRIRTIMEERGLKVAPGSSWVFNQD